MDGIFEMEGIDDLPLVPGVSSTGMDMLPDVPPAGVTLEAVQVCAGPAHCLLMRSMRVDTVDQHAKCPTSSQGLI